MTTKLLPLDPLEPEVTVTATANQTKAIQPGGADSPGRSIMMLGTLGTRIIEKDGQNFVVLTHEGALEFYLSGRLVGVLSASGEFRIRGKTKEVRTSLQSPQPASLTPDGGIEFSGNGPAWSFGIAFDGQAISAGRLHYDGSLTIYRFAESRFPLTAAASPSFGSDYVINESGVTHISADRSRTLVRIDPELLSVPAAAGSIDTGWILPQTAAEQADAGIAWSNDNNILADDENLATSVLTAGADSKTMRATNYAFGLNNSEWYQIIGIEMKYSRAGEGALGVAAKTIQLVSGGSQTGDNKASEDPGGWPALAAFATVGGAADVWSSSTTIMQGADLQTANFGVAIKATNGNPGFTLDARIWNVQMRLYLNSVTPLQNAIMNLRSIKERTVI